MANGSIQYLSHEKMLKYHARNQTGRAPRLTVYICNSDRQALEYIASLVNAKSHIYPPKQGKTHRLFWFGRHAVQFCQFIYQDSEELRLTRKYSIYQEYLTARYPDGVSPNTFWEPQELDLVKKLYPYIRNDELAKLLPRHTLNSIRFKARALGLKKTPATRSRISSACGHAWPEADDLWLRQFYATASHQELRERFPNHTIRQIQLHANKVLSLKRSVAAISQAQKERALIYWAKRRQNCPPNRS